MSALSRKAGIRYRRQHAVRMIVAGFRSERIPAKSVYKRAAIAGPKSSRTRAAELLISATLISRFSTASAAAAELCRLEVSAISAPSQAKAGRR